MQFYKVVEVDRLVDGRGRVAWAGTTKVAVFKIGDEVFAIKNFCPHAGGSLGTGQVKGEVVYCPRHQWGFNVRSGACLTNRIYSVERFDVEVRDGYVWVAV